MKTIRLFLFVLLGLLMAAPAAALDVDVTVSSFRVDIDLGYGPENLLDNDPATAWIGGGIGPGTGQWIDLNFGIPVRVLKIGIYNGHQADGQFEKYRRIRSGRIVYPDGREIGFWLRDEPGEQMIKCSGRPTKSLRIVVNEVFPRGDIISDVKLAVSELKLYVALMADPTNPEAEPSDAAYVPAPPPADTSNAVPEAIKNLLRSYYVKQTSLADDYHTLFAADVQDRNDFRFEVFKEVQRQLGTYAALRSAEVDPSGLGFEIVRLEGKWAEVRVFGSYHVKVADLDQDLEEDSVFVLSKGTDGWKIVELEGQQDGI